MGATVVQPGVPPAAMAPSSSNPEPFRTNAGVPHTRGLTPERARLDVQTVMQHVQEAGMEAPDTGGWDRIAMVARDVFVCLGVDPGDMAALRGAFAGAWLVLNQAVNAPMPIVGYGAGAWSAEVIRRWIDGEAPVMSQAEIASLKGLEGNE